MKSLLMTAAVALLAGGAYAQSDCPLECSKAKEGAAITQVADEAKNCTAEQKAQCAEKAAECAAKAQACGGAEGAAITQVANEAKNCTAEQKAQCAEKAQACSGAEGAAAITLAATTTAGPGCGGCADGDADCGKCANKASCTEAQQVSFESWRKTIPVMGYSVGEKTTTCSKSAAAMASECDSEVAYVVNGQKFESQADAMAAHTAALNSHLDSMTRVSFVVAGEDTMCPATAGAMCEKTGQAMQYRVGPAVFDSAEKAVKAAAMAYGMSHSVAMSYEVDGEATTCSKSAAKMSESCGKGMTYVVGSTKTGCDVQSANLLANERLVKALDAI